MESINACSAPAYNSVYTKNLLLAVYFVRHSQFFAVLSATRSQYATTISRLHTLTETMLVVSFSVVGLECSFHCVMLFFV